MKLSSIDSLNRVAPPSTHRHDRRPKRVNGEAFVICQGEPAPTTAIFRLIIVRRFFTSLQSAIVHHNAIESASSWLVFTLRLSTVIISSATATHARAGCGRDRDAHGASVVREIASRFCWACSRTCTRDVAFRSPKLTRDHVTSALRIPITVQPQLPRYRIQYRQLMVDMLHASRYPSRQLRSLVIS